MTRRAANSVDALVGSRIRIVRMRRKMTLAALGELLDVTFQQVQKYEKGANRVGASRLHQIANVLGVPVSEFFAGAEAGRKSVPLSTLVFDPQAFRIAEAFVKISDKKLRASLVRLVESMTRKSGDSG